MKHMSEVGIRALKQNASAVVAQAAAGEVLTITDRGRPVAQLMPIHGSKLDRLVAAGLVNRPTRALRDLPEPVLDPSQPSLSEVLRDMREDER